MNKRNVKVWQEDGCWWGEWSDRALDDDDRYKDKTAVILLAHGETEKQMWGELSYVYDEWIRFTRGD